MAGEAAIFIKSFRPDFEALGQLVDSIETFARVPLPVVVSVPAADEAALIDRIGRTRVRIVRDEDYAGGRDGLTGWEHQQVCKLSAWRLGLAETLFSIDSDSYFIRPFGPETFLGANGRPQLVMSRLRAVFRATNQALVARLLEDDASTPVERPPATIGKGDGPDLRPWLAKALADRWADTHVKRARLSAIFSRSGGHFHAMPGAILDTRLLCDLHDRLLAPQGLTMRDLILICPWEYDWQLEWALATGFDFDPCEPLLFHVDSEVGHAEAMALGISEAHVARHFHGIAMASRHLARLRF